MATSLLSNPYSAQQGAHYSYVQPPQPPPSPPMDEQKCSLPSISNLLGLADAGSPTSETSPESRAQQQGTTGEFGISERSRLTESAATPAPSERKPDTRPNSSHYGNQAMMRGQMPPTPPMSNDNFEGYPSPSTKSVSHMSVMSQANNYYYETTPPLDEHRPMAPIGVSRVPVQAYGHQSFAPTSYMSQPMASYYPPMQPTPPPQPQISGLYYQRPLPQV
jgi:hypothetical protein